MSEIFQDILDLVLKASNEGIWDWNVGEEEIYYSERILEFFGCDQEDAPNFLKYPERLLVAKDASYLQNILTLTLMDDEEELFAVDCRIRRLSDRKLVWLRVRAVVVRENGEAVRLVGSMIDISKRKKAEEALAEERAMLRLVVDNVPVQIYFKDTHSRFTLVNKRQAEWVGCASENDLIGKSDADFYAPKGAKMTHLDELHIMETGKPILGAIQREMWPQREDTYVQVVKQPWYDGGGRLAGTFGVATDVTGIVNTQSRLEEIALDLQARNRSFKEELDLAREVQQALLPGNSGLWSERVAGISKFAKIEHKYIPATELAGDYYDVLPLGAGKVGLFICDVMGHGVRSALIVSMIRGLIEKASQHAADPAKFLEKINKGLCRILGPTDVDMFATACYVVVDVPQGEIRLASAGHDLPLLLDREGLSLIAQAQKKGPALGFFEEAHFENAAYALDRVSEVLLFTDGIYEASNADGEEWGESRFAEVFVQLAREQREQKLDGVCSEAMRWVAEKGFDDDVCMLSIQMQQESYCM